MTVHQRLLHGVQYIAICLAVAVRMSAGAAGLTGLARALALEVFDGEQGLALQAGQELDAGVDGLQTQAVHGVLCAGLGQLGDDHGAGAAIAFVAAFLGAGAVCVLAQPLQHGASGMRALHLDHFSAMEEAYGLCVMAIAHDRGTEMRRYACMQDVFHAQHLSIWQD